MNRLRTTSTISANQLLKFTQRMSMLLGAGVSLMDSLEAQIKGCTDSKEKYLYRNLKAQVEKGTSLSKAMKKYPRVFDVHYINMVQVGEASGIMNQAFERLSVHQQNMDNIRKTLRSALIYPAVVISVAVLAVSFLIIFIVPVFAEMYKDFDRELPLLTQSILEISRFTGNYSLPILLVGLLLFCLLSRQYRLSHTFKLYTDSLLLKVPAIGIMIQMATLSRLFRSVEELTNHGVPLLEAVNIGSKSIANAKLAQLFSKVPRRLAKGVPYSNALHNTGVIEGHVIEVIRTGEKGGEIGKSLQYVADQYEEEFKQRISTALQLIEPAVIILLGSVIAVILIAMYMPMFDLGNMF